VKDFDSTNKFFSIYETPSTKTTKPQNYISDLPEVQISFNQALMGK